MKTDEEKTNQKISALKEIQLELLLAEMYLKEEGFYSEKYLIAVNTIKYTSKIL